MPKRDKAPQVVSLDQVLKLLRGERDELRLEKRLAVKFSIDWHRAGASAQAIDDLIVKVRKLTSYRGATRLPSGLEVPWTF